jgi:hypothetical protein
MQKITPILILLTLFTGCQTFKNAFRPKEKAPPMITASNPTLEQITSAINRNSQMIRNLTTENASIYVPGVLVPLHSRLTFERPKRIRIQGSASSLGGQELDFGSNDTLFWLWVRRIQGEMWYCRHDQFPACPVRSMVPIEPDWFIEALGIIEFKATDRHEGPTATADGNWLITSYCQTESGQFTKRTVIDAKVGWVLRQEMYSPQGELVALSAASDHRYDKGTGIYYAKRVELQCHGTEGKMTFDLGTPTFNVSSPFATVMFQMPTFDGYRATDLCSPEFLQNRGAVMPNPFPQQPIQQPIGTSIPQASIETVIR